MGQEIVGFSQVAGGLLGIYQDHRISILYGSSSSDWALVILSYENGAIEWTIQKLAEPIYLTPGGLSTIASVQEYGDFKTTALSAIIEPYFTTYQIGSPKCSVRIKLKNQYRLFYDDKTALNLTFDGRGRPGFTRIRYDDQPICACSGYDSDDNEMAFFGCDDGFVYQLEKGTSFDGGAITALLKTSLNILKSPENTKRFFKISLEIDDQIEEGEWSIGSWGNFEWGEQGEERTESYLDETGTGYDYLYYSNSAYLNPFVLQGIILHFSVGGLKR